MALKHTITETNNFGIETTLADCYIKVGRIVGDKTRLHGTALFMNAAQDNLYFERSYEFVPSVADGSNNFIAQAYAHLKTLPEFAGAVDC